MNNIVQGKWLQQMKIHMMAYLGMRHNSFQIGFIKMFLTLHDFNCVCNNKYILQSKHK